MDQAKWCIPRVRGGCATKSMAKFERPKCKIQGIWFHKAILTLHIIDVRQSQDASTVVECLCQDLEKISTICRSLGKPFPKRLLLWVDNTVKECKNNTFMKFLSWMLLQKGMEMTGVCMARVGHTHCAIGFLDDINV